MLDQNAVKALLEEEIRREVQGAVSQEQWLADLENQIIEFVQARIVAKFSNIGTVPDLIQTVEHSVQKLFEDGFVPNIDHLIDNTVLTQAVDQAIENLVETTINNLTLDSRWLDKIQNLVTTKMSEKIIGSLRETDLNQKLESIVLDHKDLLIAKLSEDFSTNGISDNASELQLTVMDGVVVVENDLVTSTLQTEGNTNIKGDLLVNGNLAIKGRINTDNSSWDELADTIGEKTYQRVTNNFKTDLTSSIIHDVKQGISFEQVQIEGEPLLNKGKLSNNVRESSLEKLGIVKNLRTSGRLGINTENPDRALSIWDDEVHLSIGKISAHTGYIGTAHKQRLHIGVNQNSSIELNEDGDVWVKNLRVGRNRIGHSKNGVPGYEGSKGDIVFNVNYKTGEPFAWICLGAYRWAELKT